MPANPENQSNGGAAPDEARSTARRTVIFARAKTNVTPPAQTALPEASPLSTELSEEPAALSYQFAPIGAGAVTEPPHELIQPFSTDTASKDAPEGVIRPIIQRRLQSNRQAEMEKKPKGKRNKLREILEELAGDDDEDDTREGQQAKVLQTKRLSRTGATPEGNPLAFRPRPDQPPEMAGLAGDAAIYTPPSAKSRGGLSLLLAWICVLLAGVVIYLYLKRPDGDKVAFNEDHAVTAARVPVPANVSDRALEIVNKALTAEKNRDFKQAAGLYKQARDEKLVLPGLNYQSVSLALEMGDYDTAFLLIDRCMAGNENVPQCLYLRANIMALNGDFAAAAENFTAACRITPFSARNYFFRAECLRRNGSYPAALEQFKQVGLRRVNPAEAELIAFRMNLTRIEANSDDGIQKQITENLASPKPSGDTLLLAAANEMSHDNYSAAAEYLQRCLNIMPRNILDVKLRDYFFRFHLQHAQVAAVLNFPKVAGPTGLLGTTSAPRARPPLVNLADRSLAEADPAGWP